MQVKRKLYEYGKKKKQEGGLDILEFRSLELEVKLIVQPSLPTLEKTPPPTYNSTYSAFESLSTKVNNALSSPTRARYTEVIYAAGVLLMRGSLHKMEIAQA
jgi:hypothetical protein